MGKPGMVTKARQGRERRGMEQKQKAGKGKERKGPDKKGLVYWLYLKRVP